MQSLLKSVALAAAAFAFGAAGAAAEPKRGGTLTFTYQPEPSALSTIATTAVPVALVSTKIFESLLEYKGRSSTPKPGLAEILDDRRRGQDLHLQTAAMT